MTIKLYNTRTRDKDDFVPIDAQNVRMYVCGPTVYDRAHLGNARPVIVFDVLYRLLRHVYGAGHVTYVRNFTDVDDKINAEAQRRKDAGAQGTLEELIHERSNETIAWFLDDMAAVGALEPNEMPRATAYIPQMVAMIKTLIKNDYAYTKPISYGHNSRAVYFNASKAPEHAFFKVDQFERYGALSGRSLDDMIAGAKSEVGEGKINPMDFVLWKPSTNDEPGWDSPWGYGRPGWHIECSAMAKALLGDTFDIHGGGLDLQFPHHENEIAQSCCANNTELMANVWMHNEMLQVEGKKMSKSLGNFFTVRDLLEKGVPGEVIRFVMLSTHYRKPMDWTEKKREEAEKTLRKWHERTCGVTECDEPWQDVVDALKDDLNTPLALSKLHTLFKSLEIGGHGAARFKASAKLVGLLSEEYGEWANVPNHDLGEFENLLTSVRATAMRTKDFSRVDAIKSALLGAGVEVKMSKESVTLTATPNFDPSKLEALK